MCAKPANIRANLTRRGVVLGLLSGCTVGPEFEAPTLDMPARFLNETPGVSRDNSAKWWTAFNDSVLNKIVGYGIENNKDIQRIAARILQSQGILASSGYQLNGNARVAEAKIETGGGESVDHTGFARTEATWKVDLFGRYQSERDAALARLEAAYADLDVWRLLFIDEVVTAYCDLRYAQELIRIIHRVLKSREDTLAATEKLALDGGASLLDVAQAKALVLTTSASAPDARVFFIRMLNRITALVGSTELAERKDLDVKAPQPLAKTDIVATGAPVNLVRNRPDIVYAEKKLAEAVGLLGVAEADLYPSLGLTSNISLSNSGGGFDPLAGFVRVNLDVPLFDRPVRQGKIDTAKGLINERQAAWEKEVVLAVEEVRNAMFALDQNTKASKLSGEAITAAAEVLRLVRELYAQGKVTFLQVLDAERAHLDTQNQHALDLRNRAVDFVDLNVALGGSFNDSERVGT